MKCLIDGKVCPNNNLKCKVCKLDDCRNTIEAIEVEEMIWYKTKEDIFYEKLEKEYPKCVNCTQLEILNLEKGKVRCPYMIRNGCALK